MSRKPVVFSRRITASILSGMLLVVGVVPVVYAQTAAATGVPKVSLDLAVGGESTRTGTQPALHTAVTIRVGGAHAIAPVIGIELGALGSGYPRNVGHIRGDGTLFNAPYLLGAILGSVGVRARPLSSLLLTAGVGAGRISPWKSAARFVDADVAVRLGASTALVLGGRSLTARDPDAARDQHFTSVTLGIRFLSDP